MSVTVTAPSVAYRFGRFELEPDERRLLASGAPVHLRPRAFDLLVALVERSGHLVTKDELLQRVWGKVIVEENTLQVNISALRKVLGANAIAAVPGRGYRFTLEVTRFDTAPIAPAASPKHNLPHDLTSFIGRDKEIAELAQLLAGTRLLTLTGSGGCGKTRLAIQLARQRADAYSDGAWLVELAALTDAVTAASDRRQRPGHQGKGRRKTDRYDCGAHLVATSVARTRQRRTFARCLRAARGVAAATLRTTRHLGHEPRAARHHWRVDLPRTFTIGARSRKPIRRRSRSRPTSPRNCSSSGHDFSGRTSQSARRTLPRSHRSVAVSMALRSRSSWWRRACALSPLTN